MYPSLDPLTLGGRIFEPQGGLKKFVLRGRTFWDHLGAQKFVPRAWAGPGRGTCPGRPS